MPKQLTRPKVTQLVVQAMLRRGFDRERVATLVGKRAGVVDSAAAGEAEFGPQALRRLAAAVGVSVEELAIEGLDRKGLSPGRAAFLKDTERLLRSMDGRNDR